MQFLKELFFLILAVTELFQGIDFSYLRLSVITLTQQNVKHFSDQETEHMTKTVRCACLCVMSSYQK